MREGESARFCQTRNPWRKRKIDFPEQYSLDIAPQCSNRSRSTYFKSHCVRLLFVADYVPVGEVCVSNGDGFSSGRAQRRGMQRVS